MGFPFPGTIDLWLNTDANARIPEVFPTKKSELKNPEIPILESYEGKASQDFWDKFPKRGLPDRATTRVDVGKLTARVNEVRTQMSVTECKRADKLLRDLVVGADSFQKSELPPINSPNSRTAVENGALLTDTIATWVKKGFVAGPFSTPPVPGFRANPLAVVVRNGKIRPILNMSGPRGRSFNDNVDKRKLEKLHMETARQFGFGRVKAPYSLSLTCKMPTS